MKSGNVKKKLHCFCIHLTEETFLPFAGDKTLVLLSYWPEEGFSRRNA